MYVTAAVALAVSLLGLGSATRSVHHYAVEIPGGIPAVVHEPGDPRPFPGLPWSGERLPVVVLAPGDLGDLLIGPLRRAQIAALKPQVRIDHADQRQLGEMEALGHQLGADDHVDRPFLDLRDEFGRAFGRIERVAGGHGHARAGQDLGHFVGDPLHPGAAGDEAVGLPAFGAGRGRRGFVAAMVAGEAAGEAMLDQPGSAIGAFEAEPAVAAQRQRGIAAPVEEQQRLFPLVQPLGQFPRQPRGQPAAALGRVLGQVHGVDRGQFRRAEAAGQLEPFVDPAFGHLQAFERRGRAGENHG